MQKHCFVFVIASFLLVNPTFAMETVHKVFPLRTPVAEECCICLASMNTDSPKHFLSCCGKSIHQKCLAPVLAGNDPRCPLCKQKIMLKAPQPQQETVTEEPQRYVISIQNLSCEHLFHILNHLTLSFLKRNSEDKFRNKTPEFDAAVQICIKRILEEKLGNQYTETTYNEYKQITSLWASAFYENLEQALYLYQQYKHQYFQELIQFETPEYTQQLEQQEQDTQPE